MKIEKDRHGDPKCALYFCDREIRGDEGRELCDRHDMEWRLSAEYDRLQEGIDALVELWKQGFADRRNSEDKTKQLDAIQLESEKRRAR